MKPEEPYRCTETIDLEEIIKMKTEQFCEKVKATVTWKSGRVEEIYDSLKKGGEFKKSFSDKVENYRKFPTVENVRVEKY